MRTNVIVHQVSLETSQICCLSESSNMVIFTHIIIVFISCLILAVHTEVSGRNITLCCPVGKQLDQFLSCGGTSNVTKEQIRTFLSPEKNTTANDVTWNVLSTDFKPRTYVENVERSYTSCLDASSEASFRFHDVAMVRKIKLNLCCPLEKVLNTTSDLCESSRNQSFKVSVQPSDSQTLTFSSYTIEEFDLKEEKPSCDPQDVSYYDNNNDVCIKNDTCMSTRFFISLTDKLTLLMNGTLQESFEKEKFCLAANQNGGPVARICYKDPCAGAPCLTKCCEQGQYLSQEEGKCIAKEVPPVDLEVKDIDGAKTYRNFSNYVSRYGIPTCDKVTEAQDMIIDKFDSNLKPKRDFWFLPNGSLVVAVFYESKVHSLYCYDQAWHNDSKTYRPIAIVCSPIDVSLEVSSGRYKVNGILMIISCIFLALTIVVHLLLLDLRNIQGITVVCNSLSLLVNFLIIGSLNLGFIDKEHIGLGLCKAMGITGHYFFMSAFAWLSVMGLDVYLSFRVSASRRSLRHRIDLKTLARYSAIAWGLPGLFSIFTVIMDNADLPYYVVTPNFGVQSCWFYSEKSVLGLYLYAPVCLFLLFNVLCFSSLAVKFYVASRDAIVLSPTDEKSSRERIFKLFVLMGISWIFEILSWAIGGPEYIWYFTDALNILKSVFVFVIFVCRRRVLDLLALRYRCFGVFLRMTFDWAPISQNSKKKQNFSMNSMTVIEEINRTELNSPSKNNKLVPSQNLS